MFIKSKKNLLKESAILIAFFITISGCSKGDDEESAVSSTGGTEESYSSSTETALPEGHPPAGTAASEPLTISDHSTVKSTKQVKLDDDVKAKWNEVKIEIIDTVDTTKEVQTIKVGDTYTVRQTGFAVKILNLSPDYSIFEDYVGTRSNEANNPAVMLELSEKGKVVAKGWVFNKIVGFDSFKNERIKVRLLSPLPIEADSTETK